MPDKLTLITDLESLSYEDAIAFINDLPFAYYRADLDGHVLAASSNAVQICLTREICKNERSILIYLAGT